MIAVAKMLVKCFFIMAFILMLLSRITGKR